MVRLNFSLRFISDLKQWGQAFLMSRLQLTAFVLYLILDSELLWVLHNKSQVKWTGTMCTSQVRWPALSTATLFPSNHSLFGHPTWAMLM